MKILITGGTGSFGQAFTRTILKTIKNVNVLIYSRDELKQFQMRQEIKRSKNNNLRFLLGDVRDRERLYRALDGVDVVVHAAALKQVPAAEYNPLEAIKTNILGAANIIDAAIDRNVRKVIALSTDKAANPVNLYGATKLCSDKLFVAANAYSENHQTCFSVVRYGNVVGSRGSVIPYFLAQRATGVLTITDTRMTRFIITLNQSVKFVLRCLKMMQGGEVFVPKIPSLKVIDLARIIGPRCKKKVIGIRPGEKLHEVMVSQDDARLTLETNDMFVIQPTHGAWSHKNYRKYLRNPKICREGFSYTSENNTDWLKDIKIKRLVSEVERKPPVDMPKIQEPNFISSI